MVRMKKKMNIAVRAFMVLMTLFVLGCGEDDRLESDSAKQEVLTSAESGGNAEQEQDEKQASESAGQTEIKLLRIAVIDSGISGEAVDMAYLAEGKNYVDETMGTEDTYGHGTAVASVIMDQAKSGNFVLVPLVNVMYKKGKLEAIDSDTLAQSIREAIDLFHCDVIHISGGVAVPTAALEEAVEYAKDRKVRIVAAVGNDYEENPGGLLYPAAYDSVISVGALDADGNRAAFSQDWADEYAVGVDVKIRLMSGREDVGSACSYAAAAYTASLIP